jgi:hypothetical protein
VESGQTRTSADVAAHLTNVVQQLLDMARYDRVVAHLNTHWSLDVYHLVAQWCNVPFVATELRRERQRWAFLSDSTHEHVLHFTPTHGSWLNHVELWLSLGPPLSQARRFQVSSKFRSPSVWLS